MEYRGKIRNSLVLRVIAPVIAIVAFIGLGLYFFVLIQVSSFADETIRTALDALSGEIYGICDRNLNDLLKSRQSGDARAIQIKKARTLGMIEDFLSQNNIKGTVFEDGKEILNSDLPATLFDTVEATAKEHAVVRVSYAGKSYFGHHAAFTPWNWHVVIVKEASEYSSLIGRVKLAYGVTGLAFLIAAASIFYYLRRTVQRPLSSIIDKLSAGEKPDYEGIYEFEFLSDSLREAMEIRERETRMLNNIYHIAVSRRGAEFFDEVATAITRMFNLSTLIARVIPSGESADVVVMSHEGELRRNFMISLKDTPCEGVLAKRHMVVIEKDVCKLYPKVELLVKTKADAYIGLAVFDRKGDVVGLVNAFGKEREFTESDIKVFQTIGQIVAIEFEMVAKDKEEERIREELFQSQKMEAIGTLAGGVAHDFNNMLQGILGYASLLRMKTPVDDPTYRPIEIIEHSAEKAAELTKQLLGFARKGKYVIEPCNLNMVIDDVLRIITRTFPRTVDIRTNLWGDLWTVEADRSQLDHVLLNLCVNARDAMPAGGMLLLETENREVGEDAKQQILLTPGKYVVVKVSDTGMGMDEEVRKHIFEPFFTTKEKGKGTGMGLAMAYGVIRNHEGHIEVESELGRGTTFAIYLPAAEEKVQEPETGQHVVPSGKGTILLVDDEEFVRSFARDILEKLGYEVIEACDGREALDKYRDGNGAIDLVLLDLIMPRMSGEQTYQRLKEINPEVKVLIASGYGIGETGDTVKYAGIAGFIQKPFKVSDIAQAVDRTLSSA